MQQKTFIIICILALNVHVSAEESICAPASSGKACEHPYQRHLRLLEEEQALRVHTQEIMTTLSRLRDELRRLELRRARLAAELETDRLPSGRTPITALTDRGAGTDEPSRVAASSSGEETTPAPRPTRPPGTPPEVPNIADVGGVLTPRGQLLIEPKFEYGNTQVNRFTFQGVEILESFLIGLLEAQDADRDYYSASLGARYGLTNRLELELSVPFVYREEQLTARIPDAMSSTTTTRELDGSGLGDIELGLHYQLNRGLDGWPFFIGNLRYKSPTGTGPFEVDRDENGLETELATGTGFHSLEPSITALYPSDPVVFWANLGYLFSFSEDVDKTFGDQTIGRVEPGDVLRTSFGMAYAVNERSSFTIGYKHDFVQETTTTINDTAFDSSALDIGALLLGFSHQIDERFSLSLNLELGVTDDSPDVLITLRTPFSLSLVD